MFQNISVKKLFISISITLLLIISANVIINYSQLDDMRIKIYDKEERVIPSTFDLLDLKINVIQVQQWLTDVSATRAHEGFDDGFAEAKVYFDEGNKVLDHLIEDDIKYNESALVKDLKEFKTNFKEYYAVGVKMAQTYVNDGPIEGNKMMLILDPFAEKLSGILELWIKEHKEENTEVSEKLKNDITSIENQSIIFGVISILIMLIGLGLLSKRILNNLEILQLGLLDFFKYLNKEVTTASHLQITTDDEFGQMAKVINGNIDKTKNAIEKDAKFLNEVALMVEEVNKGYLFKRLKNKTETENLELLRQNFNAMLENLNSIVGEDTSNILNVLKNYAKLDFTTDIQNDNAKIPLALNNVNQLITDMLIESKSNGLTLERSSDVLIKNVDLLNNNSNIAATALEETAAALEEITSNISQNTNNITKMSSHAVELQDSVTMGDTLAQETTQSMDEINKEVSAINEAITVIDQISFQTNILSLNAAVEAATAGEAGKGFAVVAQEVRNLASRSAEAANEIKTLVENATKKANIGKEISDKMKDGYTNLNTSISKTLTLISDVENASKEQLRGIEQINDAVNSLDKQTQENANIASRTNNIALQTDKIAQLIVQNANDKEFRGKNEVTAK